MIAGPKGDPNAARSGATLGEAASLGPVPLALVIADVLQQVEPTLREHEAEVTIEGPLPVVVGQRGVVVQIVASLLVNAVTYVARGITPSVRLWADRAGPMVRLWLKDNGIGIAPENQERIFCPEGLAGAGVALAVARKGADRMRGRIGVESAPGAGSSFWLECSGSAEFGPRPFVN